MLRIAIPLSPEEWDEKTEQFVQSKVQILQLEHSLVSLSKWESKWHKPFLSRNNLTIEETLDYIKCMTLTQNVDPDVYNHITQSNIDEIVAYINDSMTATTFRDDNSKKHSNEIVTSELIYYWMIALQIPMKCEKWHLNRLLTLVKVCNIKNQPPKKANKREIMSRNAALNAARRKQMNTRG